MCICFLRHMFNNFIKEAGHCLSILPYIVHFAKINSRGSMGPCIGGVTDLYFGNNA